MNVINLTERLASEMDEDMASFTPGTLPGVESIEQHAGMFRRFVTKFSEQAAAARRELRTELKILSADRKAEEERHRAAIAALDDAEAEARARGKEQEAAALRLADCYRDALATSEERL
jgi:hypothetical protein